MNSLLLILFSATSLYAADLGNIKKSFELNTAAEMYLYAWPLVMTNLTRVKMDYLPDNLMLPLPVFPNPNLTAIVKPNVDTLYDAGWINHEKMDELVLTVPDTNDGVYYLFPLLDAWTNIVDTPGWRTTGKNAQTILIRGPNAKLPDDPHADDEYDMVMQSPTNTVYLLGRTNVVDQHDLRPTQEQMFSYRLKPRMDAAVADLDSAESKSRTKSYTLKSGWSKREGSDDPTTVEIIFAMDAEQFFNTFAEMMVLNPPVLPQDEDIVRRMFEEYGLVAGKTGWQYSDLSAEQQKKLSAGMTAGIGMLYSYPVKRVNGWTIPDMQTAAFADDYYLRAYIALVLYAASLPEDTVYFETELMSNSAEQVYELEFSPQNGGAPPTNEFWSVTMYSDEGYLVANQNEIYSISSQQSDLKVQADGTVRITMSMQPPPDADLSETNWLPTPQAGEDFQLTLRVFWPQDPILQGTWVPPKVAEVTVTQDS